VYVCSSAEEAEAALTELQTQFTGWFSFLLEEKLTGPEISIIGLTDGREIKMLAPSQDHKQLLAGDQGPNTGGMGAYCPVPFANDNVLAAIRRDIVDPTLRGLQNEQFAFHGLSLLRHHAHPQRPQAAGIQRAPWRPRSRSIAACPRQQLG
jgi:phosphoribosylamine--glycine ligase